MSIDLYNLLIPLLSQSSFHLQIGNFSRFANTPSDRDAIALERKSLEKKTCNFEMTKTECILHSYNLSRA